jgi:AbrB family transcriptional regulator (stage V sporulation protein T)
LTILEKYVILYIENKERWSLNMTRCTGIIRRVDDLGRVVIPKEIRRKMKIREGDSLLVYTTGNGVLFEKEDVSANIIDTLKTVIDDYEDNLTKDEIEDICRAIKSIRLRAKED